MKVGNHVITFHRPEAIKERWPGDKERATAAVPLQGRPKASKKGLVRIDRLSPYNRLPSIAAVNQALKQLPQATSPGEIVDRVGRAIRNHVAVNGAMPTWLILGDMHGQPASQMMALAALHECRSFAGPKTYSFERTPGVGRSIRQWIGRRPRLLEHCLRNDIALPFPGVARPQRQRLLTTCMLADLHGFGLHAFDESKKTALDLQEREQAMLASLAYQTQPGSLNIVLKQALAPWLLAPVL